jgi:hypothetical protein
MVCPHRHIGKHNKFFFVQSQGLCSIQLGLAFIEGHAALFAESSLDACQLHADLFTLAVRTATSAKVRRSGEH